MTNETRMTKSEKRADPADFSSFVIRISSFHCGLGLQASLCNSDQFAKSRRIGRGQIRDYLAIQGHSGRLQPFDEPAVRDPGRASGGVDADLPEGAKSAFFGPAVAEGVLAAMIDGIRGITVKF